MVRELLLGTGSDNLLMVFGEPGLDVRPAGEGTIEVEVKGLDFYDPTTGVLRISSLDDIAASFIDAYLRRRRLLRAPRLLHGCRRPQRQAPPRAMSGRQRRSVDDVTATSRSRSGDR